MAVAAELARIRAQVGTATAPPRAGPSLLHDAKAAARVPRSDMAGLACNGLDALAAADPCLASLAEPLLLRESRLDRAVLPPDRAALVSAAVITAANRLAPVFLLRQTHKVLEWIVRGLEVGRLGSDKEVDALLVAALPFHGTSHFVRFVRAVLVPSARRPQWAWLMPVVRQNKPVTIDYLAKNAPLYVLRAVIRHAAQAARMGIASVPLSSLLANLLGRRFASRKFLPAVDRRTLLLECLDALASKKKATRGTTASPTAARSINEVSSALLLVMAVGVTAGVDADVAQAVMHGAALVAAKPSSNQALVLTAVTCLVVCGAHARVAVMSSDVAGVLSQWGKLPEVLSRVGNGADIHMTFSAFVLALVDAHPHGLKDQIRLRDALATSCGQLVSNSLVTTVVERLLEVYSRSTASTQGEHDEDVSSLLFGEKVAVLAQSLSPLSRGRHATAVDKALRHHFAARRRTKSDKYSAVDAALDKALDGTPFAIIKCAATSSNEDHEMGADTLLACLDHPEPAVRRAALGRLAGAGQILAPESLECGDVSSSLGNALLRRVSMDSDMGAVVLAMQSSILTEICEHDKVLAAVGARYRADFGAYSAKKKRKHSGRLQKFASAAIDVCRRIVESGNCGIDLQNRVLALLVGLDMDEQLVPGDAPEYIEQLECILTHAGDVGIALWSKAKSMKKGEAASIETEAATHQQGKAHRKLASTNLMLSFALPALGLREETLNVIGAMSAWDTVWGVKMIERLFAGVEKAVAVDESALAKAFTSLRGILSLFSEHVPLAVRALTTVFKALPHISNLSAREYGLLITFWDDLVRLERVDMLNLYMDAMCRAMEADDVYAFLRRVRGPAALEWRAAMAVSGVVNGTTTEVVMDLVIAAYSDDVELRDAGVRTASKLSLTGLQHFNNDLQLIVRGVSMLSASPKKDRVLSQTDVLGLLGSAVPILSHGFPPLSCALQSADAPNLRSALGMILQKALCKEQIVSHRIYLLRAAEGHSFPDCSTLSAIMGILGSTNARNPDVPAAELLARLVLLLPSSRVEGPALDYVINIAKRLCTLSEIDENNTEVSNALFQQAVISGLFKLLGVLSLSTKKQQDVCELATEHIFMHASRSSPVGLFAVDLLLGDVNRTVSIEHFRRLLCNLSNSLPRPTKAARRAPRDPLRIISSGTTAMTMNASTGALEMLGRHVEKLNIGQGHSQCVDYWWTLGQQLWLFVSDLVNCCNTDHAGVVEELEYEFNLALSILSGLHRQDTGEAPRDNFVDVSVAVSAVFYPGMGFDGELTALKVATRRSALELVEAIVHRHGQELQGVIFPIFKKHVQEGDSERSLRSLLTLLPPLLASGLSVETLVQWLIEASNECRAQEPRSSLLGSRRRVISACLKACPDVRTAVSLTIASILSASTEARELTDSAICETSELLLDCGINVIQQLQVLVDTHESVRCRFVAKHLLHPIFLRTLAEATRSKSRAVDGATGPNVDKLLPAFENLFAALLSAKGNVAREDALGAVLALVPMEAFCPCVRNAILTGENVIAVRAIDALVQRLDAVDVALRPSWRYNTAQNDRKASEQVRLANKSLVLSLGEILRSVIGYDMCDNGDRRITAIPLSLEVRQGAVVALEKLNRRLGMSNLEEMLRGASLLIKVVRSSDSQAAVAVPREHESECAFVSSAVLCLTSLTTTLSKRAVTLVPSLTNACVAIMESVLHKSSNPSTDHDDKPRDVVVSVQLMMIEAAVRACHSILDNFPRFFGQKTLSRLAVLATTVDSDLLNKLLLHATAKVKPATAIAALAHALDAVLQMPESQEGVLLIMRAASGTVESMRKSDAKILSLDVFNLCLKGMDYRSHRKLAEFIPDAGADFETAAFDNALRPCLAVERACRSTLVSLVLRLPESEFKQLFNRLLAWVEGSSLSGSPAEAVATLDLEVTGNLLRATPVYSAVSALFAELQVLMCPYFAHLLDRALAVISSKHTDAQSMRNKLAGFGASAKSRVGSKARSKRSRGSFEHGQQQEVIHAGQVLMRMQRELSNLCLENIALFLKHAADGTTLSSATILKMQEGLLSAFDHAAGEFAEVRSALSALGSRIVATGAVSESREESRALLVGLSRSLLLRTRDEQASVRAGSLECARTLAGAVGDEYLVALPEAMPVLADVIDDENGEVEKAARAFVVLLEDLAGESILDQLT